MLIFLILFTLLLIGLYFLGHHAMDAIGFALALVSGTMLLTAIDMLPMNYYTEKANIEKFKITKSTYAVARKAMGDDSIAERAAIQMDIAEQNRWLVKTQYWNDTLFDIWFPDAVVDLKPLK